MTAIGAAPDVQEPRFLAQPMAAVGRFRPFEVVVWAVRSRMSKIDPFPPFTIIGVNVGTRIANRSFNHGDKIGY